jgi:hypothetical protein
MKHSYLEISQWCLLFHISWIWKNMNLGNSLYRFVTKSVTKKIVLLNVWEFLEDFCSSFLSINAAIPHRFLKTIIFNFKVDSFFSMTFFKTNIFYFLKVIISVERFSTPTKNYLQMNRRHSRSNDLVNESLLQIF